MDDKTEQIISHIKGTWLDKPYLKDSTQSAETKAWDSAILTASEFIRRYTGDENLAGEIHELLSKCLPK
jgi:hypothetical protein